MTARLRLRRLAPPTVLTVLSLDRVYGEPAEPVAPSPARERLLVAAAALPECGAVVLEGFLGVEG